MSKPYLEPFAIIPWQVAADSRLTKSDLRVLIALLSFRASDTRPLWATRKQLAQRTRLLETNITRSTTHLEKLGWVVKHRERRKPTVYSFQMPIECVIRDDGGRTIVRTLDGEKVNSELSGSCSAQICIKPVELLLD